jgi:hypothetical protein
MFRVPKSLSPAAQVLLRDLRKGLADGKVTTDPAILREGARAEVTLGSLGNLDRAAALVRLAEDVENGDCYF